MPGTRDSNLQPGRFGGRAEARKGSAGRPASGLRCALVAAALALAVGCGGDDANAPTGPGDPSGPNDPPTEPPARPTLDPTYRPSGHAAAGHAFVHLFEWKWTDVAAECESVLGPAGWEAVQVSPPQEHIVLASHPWWTRYQPVSYSIDASRSGTRAEFVEMVERCEAAGVDIYVDAVINHMTAGEGTGTAGTAYTKYEYPGLYSQADFHPPCAVSDYRSEENVQDCELLGLADLDTGRTYVQRRIAGYLIDLAGIGVAGFRIDAAKHVQPVELDAILDRLNDAAGPGPYVFAEVIDFGGEAVEAADYFGLGYGSGGVADITDFRFHSVARSFRGGSGTLADLESFSPAVLRVPADKAVMFVENHDTQRDGSALDWRLPARYRLATVWMLAQPLGYPKVMSSYAFGGRDAGPPSDAAGATRDVTCAPGLDEVGIGDWVCEHRDPAIAGMVAFRRAVAGTGVEDWWDDGGNAIAFSRGDRGFVAMSLEAGTEAVETTTGLAPGTYCDVLSGGLVGGACVGRAVDVEADGAVSLDLEFGEAVALHAGARL